LISFHLQQGAKFIATNPDHYTMISDYRLPGNGSFVACMELASGIKAEVAGKPNPFILEYLMAKFKLNREDCLMIGDNLDTDVQLGRNGGINTLCVLTGNSTEKMVQEVNTATYYCHQLL
jgi:4-nitrophenyl phosphatase